MRICIISSVVFFFISVPSFANDIYIEYDCSTMPNIASPPWEIIGRGNYQLTVNSGILHMENPDNLAWVLIERVDSLITESSDFYVEARVKIPNGDGYNASPQIALTSIDYNLPYGNRSHIWYAVDLYPGGISFTLIDNDNAGGGKFFGSYSIPDFDSCFHKITLYMHDSGDTRDFYVYVDDIEVISALGEDKSRVINAVDVGYGLEVSIGDSYWDYVKYWSEDLIDTDNISWGSIKTQFK